MYVSCAVILSHVLVGTGYPLEVHEVVTKDGYLLRMERIPLPASEDTVFMMHGEEGRVVQGAAAAASRGVKVLLEHSF